MKIFEKNQNFQKSQKFSKNLENFENFQVEILKIIFLSPDLIFLVEFFFKVL